MQHGRPTLSPDYATAWRSYALDGATMLVAFFAAALAAGRVWRLPFDDEIYTLAVIAHYSPFDLAFLYPGRTDVHPPLSYLLFGALQQAGLSEAGMRLVSLAMTALAMALFHLLALSWIAQRNGVAIATRLIAVLLFGLC